jgi:putative transposase
LLGIDSIVSYEIKEIGVLSVNRVSKPMMGLKYFHPEHASIDGIETAHIIRTGQLSYESIPLISYF